MRKQLHQLAFLHLAVVRCCSSISPSIPHCWVGHTYCSGLGAPGLPVQTILPLFPKNWGEGFPHQCMKSTGPPRAGVLDDGVAGRGSKVRGWSSGDRVPGLEARFPHVLLVPLLLGSEETVSNMLFS